MSQLDWYPIIRWAKYTALGYHAPITLRQVFYRCVDEGLIPNTKYHYRYLGTLLAESKRQGRFPVLHNLYRPPRASQGVQGVQEPQRRPEGFWTIYIVVEKLSFVAQLDQWFGEPLGIPIRTPLPAGRLKVTQNYVDSIAADVARQKRPAVLLYAGDHDQPGEDMRETFIERTDCWTEVRHVALTEDQADGLPKALGPLDRERYDGRWETDVELDALPPPALRALFDDALGHYWSGAVLRVVA